MLRQWKMQSHVDSLDHMTVEFPTITEKPQRQPILKSRIRFIDPSEAASMKSRPFDEEALGTAQHRRYNHLFPDSPFFLSDSSHPVPLEGHYSNQSALRHANLTSMTKSVP
ncbi:unnamed protein product [Hydatigera taeniaeformis]|uniref:HDNR domain-containing protein n=1 Tax=Hydatigena taeniaeformis TaxID=6205 RepID=A0A0R3XD23_HYDTA|nr:unnamed protein product [Hydatigera taeniaeformis]